MRAGVGEAPGGAVGEGPAGAGGALLARAPMPMVALDLRVAMAGPLRLPAFRGSLLRGVFGAALRDLACVTGAPRCDGCPVAVACAWPALFAPLPRDLSPVGLERLHEGLPPPFVLEVGTGDGSDAHRLDFRFLLVGEATAAVPLVLAAWREAFARGLGRARVPGRIVAIRADTGSDPVPLADGGPWPEPEAPVLAQAGSGLVLDLVTPLRLQAGGVPVRAGQLTPRMLVAAIIRRARLMAIHADADSRETVRRWPVDDWLAAAEAVRHAPELQWVDLWRRSARQGQRMNFGGLVGRWHWEGVAEPLQALLALGALLHVGKEASFGLGAIRVAGRPDGGLHLTPVIARMTCREEPGA